jgi:nucleoside-diphosphate-sugar epimerase
MRIYLVGHKGWIGQMVSEYCKDNDIEVISSDHRGESKELLEDILTKNVSHVFCCLGRTHGTLNGKTYTTIDYLQNQETLRENINDNLYVPLRLGMFCEKNGIHFTYLGTGCIYSYEDEKEDRVKKIFTEESIPNFFGSNYSIVKGFTNMLINNVKCLHLRIRMPITSEKNPRNFITKITSYEKICSIPNSMSVLDELIPVAIHMMKENIVGTVNLTNPGVISHNEILEMYRDIVDPLFVWKNFTLEEQDKVLLSKRSNNHLDTLLLEMIYTDLRNKYPDLILNKIDVAIKNCLEKYKI